MFSFTNDYNEIAHPKVLQSFLENATHKKSGYGLDDYCNEASNKIKSLINAPNSQVHFFTGGTITNLTFIRHILKPSHAVIAAQTGHIFVHEAGAIEATGHKVINVQSTTGKLTPKLIKPVLDEHVDEHMVIPKLIYISNSTEVGTVYSKKELKTLFEFCQKNKLYLFLDGARLAMGLRSAQSDLTWQDLAQYTDAFYIGGTKVGAMFGEALVINNLYLNDEFRYTMKQSGAIMAKSWVIGMQFLALLKDDLYLDLGAHSNLMAKKIGNVFKNNGFTFTYPVETNQVFVNIPEKYIQSLLTHFNLLDCGKIDDSRRCLRFCTSWSTKDSDVEKLQKVLKLMFKNN